MIRVHPTMLSVVGLCGTLACAGNRQAIPSEIATGRLCSPDRVATQHTSWHEVSGEGFTYCVPVTWRAVDSRGSKWRGPGIEFELGSTSPGDDRRVPFVVRRIGGEDVGFQMRPSHADGARARVSYVENIDARIVQLVLDHPSGRHERGAMITTKPDLVVYGTAKTEEAVTDIQAAYRSIRFSNNPEP